MVLNKNLKLQFVTSNVHKFKEALEVIKIMDLGITLIHHEITLPELQNDDLAIIAQASLKSSILKNINQIFVEDTGLFIESLNGFPGPYSAYVLKTIGSSGIIKLMQGSSDRRAYFRSVIAYRDGSSQIHIFEGMTEGTISSTSKGEAWGFNPIFVPNGADQTYAEMGIKKVHYSHRRRALERLLRFVGEQ